MGSAVGLMGLVIVVGIIIEYWKSQAPKNPGKEEE